MRSVVGFLLVLVVSAAASTGQAVEQPAPAGLAARRFPQLVRVGDLVRRPVLRTNEAKSLIGRVQRVVRRPDGQVAVILTNGGLFGFGARPVAVPVDAMALLGDEMQVVDLTKAQLDALPTDDGGGATPIGADETIRVALARPSH